MVISLKRTVLRNVEGKVDGKKTIGRCVISYMEDLTSLIAGQYKYNHSKL